MLATAVSLRWMTANDAPEVAAMEKALPHPISERRLKQIRRSRNVVAMVADCHGHIMAYALYEIFPCRLELWRLVVHPLARRQKLGTAVLQQIIRQRQRCQPPRLLDIKAWVRENDLAAQLFMKANAFRAVAISHTHFGDTQEDAYRFSFPGKCEE